ncbi:MAG: prolyl oligopeptidase family serine peptidase [Proteobacteria bacterium]|nr:prolyl oligopeptidase family serine peptidase [Pseudomonadota bacterium]MBI3496925.1 prolyl oligopeptidase family serine peptidase [Pseudomonadota bacterium]
MIFERTNYYAKPGREAAVLATRRKANAVRVALGLPAGSIYLKAGGEGPDVSWECEFADAATHQADLKARAESAEFERVRSEMREAIARFERHLESRDADLSGRVGARTLAGLPIVPRELAFQSGGLTLKGFLYMPPGTGPFPCMIRNHGSGIQQGSTDISRPGTASWLLSWGIASFLPHRRGYGNSPGTPWRQDCSAEFGTPEYDEQIARRLDGESDDVLAALDFVETLPEIERDRIGVMGSSFGGVNTLLAAAKSDRFRCGIDFAGAAMNWDRTPQLRRLMLAAAHRLTRPMFFIQAASDYSIRPTIELAAALAGSGKVIESRIYPDYGINRDEGHLFESTGQLLWAPDVRRFLERWL